MQRLYFLLFLLITCFQCEALKLTETFQSAPEKSFIAYAHKKTFTLTRIAKKEGGHLWIEEISAPQIHKPTNWNTWLEQKCPGHTSWTLTEIDLNRKTCVRSYCLLKKRELGTKEFCSFLATLLSLNFEKVPLPKRKRLGVQGGSDDLMPRKLWQPKAPSGVELKRESSYSAYQARWPRDSSSLSGQLVDIYFLSEPSKAHERAFPHWIEVRHAAIKGSIYALSVGENLNSPHAQRALKSNKLGLNP